MMYTEINSELSDQDRCEQPLYTIRLNPLDDVSKKLRSNPHRLIIIKPLVESQRAREILDHLCNARAFWIYRNYRDVVSSMAAKWGYNTGVGHLTPILKADPTNWRSEGLLPSVTDLVAQLQSDGISGADGWGLFWYARNSLFFSQLLNKSTNCLLLKYEKLVLNPSYLRTMLLKIGIRKSLLNYSSPLDFHQNSVSKGKDIIFSPNIQCALDAMQDKLDKAEDAQGLPPVSR